MSARRQPSTTSLSKYARAHSPAVTRSLDFCNSFWGIGDGGVDVLFARMRGAMRTMEELKNFWKERAAIEEEYAKRLAKLAKTALGKDEIGELRNSLDTIRLETDKQAGYHLQLAQQIKTDLEGQTTMFTAKQTQHKKAYQAVIEKEFRSKQLQEGYVNKAREKYETDCRRINTFTAEASLVQGKELEKIQLKLERAQQTVQANELDFSKFAKALQDTVQKWEQNWKDFCDSCQDLEEERLEFMKDNMWAYANAVSTVCVHDDESCEKTRLALEQLEPEKDMENFVRDYGTGNLIPDPPAFVNYADADAASSSSSRPITHPAHFTRITQRTPSRIAPASQPPAEPFINTAGVGAGSSRRTEQQQSEAPVSRGPTHSRAASQRQNQVQVNGTAVNGGGTSSRRPTQSNPKPVQDPNAEPIDPTVDTMLKVGSNAYKVDLSNDPQQGPSRPSGSSSTSTAPPVVDPLAKQLEELKNAVRRSGTWKPTDTRMGQSASRKGTLESIPGPSNLNAPSSSAQASGSQRQPSRDYRSSAENVVGVHPSASRPASPNPPTASFMQDPSKTSPHPDVGDIIASYQQSLPGERKPISRSNSAQGNHVAPPPGQTPGLGHNPSLSQGQNLARPVSREGHPGIGAHGRSSPQPPLSRSASPARANVTAPQRGPPPGPAPGPGYYPGSTRAVSPNRVGIALDPNGTVVVDSMAERYNQQQRQLHQQREREQQQMQAQQYGAPARRSSYIGNVAPPPPIQPSAYGVAPPTSYPVANQPYGNPPVPQRHAYNPVAGPYQPTAYQQAPMTAYGAADGVQRGPGYGVPMPPPPQAVYGGGYQAPNTMARTPSPLPPPDPPTGQKTEEGLPILFYVKALYDYAATIEEEFDFQSGDIIAVTATPEDGWWSGQLLDEARRQRGRHVFPSNFVCLF